MARTTEPRVDPAGKIRYTVILSADAHKRLTEITTQHGISQAEVMETLLSNAQGPQWAAKFDSVRDAKVKGRVQKKQLIEKLKDLDPSALARLVEQARKQPA